MRVNSFAKGALYARVLIARFALLLEFHDALDVVEYSQKVTAAANVNHHVHVESSLLTASGEDGDRKCLVWARDQK